MEKRCEEGEGEDGWGSEGAGDRHGVNARGAGNRGQAATPPARGIQLGTCFAFCNPTSLPQMVFMGRSALPHDVQAST